MALLACSKQVPPPAPGVPAGSGGTETPAADSDPGRPSDPRVSLLEAGREPRAVLRYRVPAGTKKTAVMDFNMTMANQAPGGGKAQIAKIPGMRMLMEMTTSPAASAAVMPVLSKVIAAEVKPSTTESKELLAAVAGQLKSMVGMTVTGTLTPRGFWRDIKVALPEGASPAVANMVTTMRSTLEQAACSWPLEAVGDGARWRVDSTIDNGVLKMTQSSLVVLQKRQDNRVVLSFQISQTAPAQDLHPPTAMPGLSMALETFAGSGKAEMDLDLAGLVPTSKTSMTSNMAFVVVAQGKRMPAATKTDMQVDLAPQ